MTPRHKLFERETIRAKTKDHLMNAVAEEIALQGYSRANINRILTKAGYAKGKIYDYFPSNRQLMLDLISHISIVHHNLISEQVLTEDDPFIRLEHFFKAVFSSSHTIFH